ncbi:MAG: beta-lactamase family protein [Candidatus Obscuribacterales bacterium]|nr:beta-lactamase family protein [Candidatus Obscuribacterales bacterium]
MRNILPALIFAASFLNFCAVCHAQAASSDYPENGKVVAAMKNFDKDFEAFLKKWQIPGASLCILYKGKAVYQRAFGFADLEKKFPVQNNSLFRIASLSKSITAVAIMMLVQKKQLSLDDRAFLILKNLKACNPNHRIDPRLYDISVKHLLNCSAGWNHDDLNDPIFGKALLQAARDCSRSLRPTAKAITRKWMEEHLDYQPGTEYSYSNVSYLILGLIIEAVTGQNYNQYIEETLLDPLKLRSVKAGQTLKSSAGEVHYYSENSGAAILPNIRGSLSEAYGSFFLLEAAPASIGWIASTYDLAKFVSCLSGEKPENLASPISSESLNIMLQKPSLDSWRNQSEWFGMGFEVDADKNNQIISFSRHGSLPGCMSLVEHQKNGISWAAAFNNKPAAYVSSREEAKTLIKKAIAKWLPELQANETRN